MNSVSSIGSFILDVIVYCCSDSEGDEYSQADSEIELSPNDDIDTESNPYDSDGSEEWRQGDGGDEVDLENGEGYGGWGREGDDR